MRKTVLGGMSEKPHRYMSTEDRFDVQNVPVPESGCWLWIGTTVGGYGQFLADGQAQLAHRYSLSKKLGRPISEGMFACHKCDTPMCVNPDHLYEGTRLDNAADAVARGQQPSGRRHHANKLTEEQVVEIRDSASPARQAARAYGVSPTTVQRIRKGDAWKHLLPQPNEETIE